jgi:ferredoxin
MPDERLLLFGIRPCDALAIACLDKLFNEFGSTKDPYYARRREKSVVVALACNEPRDTCFCTSVGGSPAGTEGADAVAFDLGDTLLLEAVTPKGEGFLESLGETVAAQASDNEARKTVSAKAVEKVRKLDTAGLKEALEKSFDSPVWSSVAEICLGCGLCTYQCPTCHCFDISDEKKGGEGRRIRTWDSCQFPLFTLHASGHNPRPSKKERMRQRIMHKFQYTVDNVGKAFCVGCGRCVANCPVNLDIRQTIKRVTSED